MLTQKREPRWALVGVGNELRGDDAAGIMVAEALQSSASEHVLVINAGTAPENFTSVLRDFAPDFVLIVDAVQMNVPPGTIRLLDIHDTESCSVATHSLSCHLFASYLEMDLNCAVKLLGIQCGQDALGAKFSIAVRRSIHKMVRVLRNLCETCQSGSDWTHC